MGQKALWGQRGKGGRYAQMQGEEPGGVRDENSESESGANFKDSLRLTALPCLHRCLAHSSQTLGSRSRLLSCKSH